MPEKKITTASVLAFERKLANSDALMYSGRWSNLDADNNWLPIAINSKDVRGTISNRLKTAIQNDPAKLDAEIQKPNLQRVDVAALPFDQDTLKISFSLRVLGQLAQPSACNDAEYQKVLTQVIDGYVKTYEFKELAVRYATNIANGRFLWRNRVGAEEVLVRVKHINNQLVEHYWEFNCQHYSLREFPKAEDIFSGNNSQPSEKNRDLAQMAEVIRQGLSGEAFALLEVEAFARIGRGQEVFPSQELVLDNSRDNKKSKWLYQVNQVAALHSQKIGNALRTIDTWYPEADEFGPIAVEPYGSVTNRGKAYRQPKDKLDFYSLLDAWVIKGQIPLSIQQHYVMATLVRGGVFGEKGE